MGVSRIVSELTVTCDGKVYRCRNEATGGAVQALGRPSDAMWVVEVDGVRKAAFAASPDDREPEVRRRLVDWIRARGR